MKPLVFLVDDDEFYLKALQQQLSQLENVQIKTFSTGETCIKHLYLNPNLIILDYHLKGIDKQALDGRDTLIKITEGDLPRHVIMLSSEDKLDIAVDCIKFGAVDYIVKNETAFVRAKHLVDNALKQQVLERQAKKFKTNIAIVVIAGASILILSILLPSIFPHLFE